VDSIDYQLIESLLRLINYGGAIFNEWIAEFNISPWSQLIKNKIKREWWITLQLLGFTF